VIQAPSQTHTHEQHHEKLWLTDGYREAVDFIEVGGKFRAVGGKLFSVLPIEISKVYEQPQ
jgi:hypothetical protein